MKQIQERDLKDKPVKLALEGIKKRFGAHNVLNGVDLSLREGESLVVIGGSGTGKSVMLKCILGLITPDSGRVLIDGENILAMRSSRARERRAACSMLFQNAALFDSLTVWENIAFGLIHSAKMSRRQARVIAEEKLTQVGLSPRVGNLLPVELSGGMKKRVGLARAVATNPDIVFFDEPTTGLDPIMSEVINDLIVKTVRDLGASALSITHDMASARKIADTVAMIYEGQIIWAGPVENIEKSGNPYVDQFVHGRAEGPIVIETAQT